jgi:hypothetical protein
MVFLDKSLGSVSLLFFPHYQEYAAIDSGSQFLPRGGECLHHCGTTGLHISSPQAQYPLIFLPKAVILQVVGGDRVQMSNEGPFHGAIWWEEEKVVSSIVHLLSDGWKPSFSAIAKEKIHQFLLLARGAIDVHQGLDEPLEPGGLYGGGGA